MNKNLNIVFIGLLVLPLVIGAQDKKGDSLKTLLSKTKNDTLQVMLLNQLCLHYEYENRELAAQYVMKAFVLAKKKKYASGLVNAYLYKGYLAEDTGDYKNALAFYTDAFNHARKTKIKSGEAASLNNLGNIYSGIAQYKKALECYNKAKIINEQTGNKKGIATQLGNMGNIYKDQGNFPKAIASYFKALKIDEQLHNSEGVSRHLGNIGIIYLEKNEFKRALLYFNKALQIDKKRGDDEAIARHLGNIGNVYLNSRQLSAALPYHLRAAKIQVKQENIAALSNTYGNVGILYYRLGDSALQKGTPKPITDSLFSLAMKYYTKALAINRQLNDKINNVIAYGNIGKLWFTVGNKNEAEKFLLHSISLADSIGAPNVKIESENTLSKLYEFKGEFEKSLIHAKEFEKLKDSVFNVEKNNALTRSELNYEFEKEEAEIKAGQARQKAKAAADRARLLLWILLATAVAVAIATSTIIIFRSLRQAKNKKTIIQLQKQLVEEKQREILDSINYAKRIQQALLPSQKYIHKKINR